MSEHLESELAALRVELQAALTDVQNGIEAFNVLAGVADSLEVRAEKAEAALQDAREALRALYDAALPVAYGGSDDLGDWKRFEAALPGARAVLVEGADGLTDSNWCNRP